MSLKIIIPCSDSLEIVKLEEIIRIEAFQNYTKVFLEGNRNLLSTLRLTKFNNGLSEDNYFMPHKSHIIQRDKILRYKKEGQIVMTDGSTVPLARRRRTDFLELFPTLK